MAKSNPLNDLAEIRSIMERSTKFLSLNTASAILAGIYALAGAFLAWRIIYNSPTILYDPLSEELITPETLPLIITAAVVLILAVGTAFVMSYYKAKKAGQNLMNRAAIRLLVNFSIPLAAGGVFVILLYIRGFYSLLAATTLIFYGLALLNAGNFTFSDIRKLGMLEIALGLLAAAIPGQGLLFWALGFGVLHIIYGAMMYWKYEKA